MSLDDFMFAMVIAGTVLSGAQLCISFRRWRFDNAAALRRELTYRHLHADRCLLAWRDLQRILDPAVGCERALRIGRSHYSIER